MDSASGHTHVELQTSLNSHQTLEAKKSYDREHVDRYIRESDDFKRVSLRLPEDLSRMRWTLDTPQDYQVLRHVLETMDRRGKRLFSMSDVLNLMKEKPELFEANREDWGRY